jgi:hypothetical protein
MSFPSDWGPYPFSISTDEKDRYITLTQISTACPNSPSGTTPYSLAIEGDDRNDAPTIRGTVMLDDDGVVKAFCNPLGGKIGGYEWHTMTGQFDADGGETNGKWTGDDPTTTEGTWAAGGGGEPFPKGAHA